MNINESNKKRDAGIMGVVWMEVIHIIGENANRSKILLSLVHKYKERIVKKTKKTFTSLIVSREGNIFRGIEITNGYIIECPTNESIFCNPDSDLAFEIYSGVSWNNTLVEKIDKSINNNATTNKIYFPFIFEIFLVVFLDNNRLSLTYIFHPSPLF